MFLFSVFIDRRYNYDTNKKNWDWSAAKESS